MYGDTLYCMNCSKVFPDIWTIFDTRIDKVISNCPHCHCMHTVNASMLLEDKRFWRRYSNSFLSELRRKVKYSKKFRLNRMSEIFYRRCEL